MNSDEFLELIQELYGDTWPRPLHRLRGARLVRKGTSLPAAAREVATTQRAIQEVLDSKDALSNVMGCSPREVDLHHRDRAIQTLGQLLVGIAAERAFVNIFREEMESNELELRDLREGRTDTDYRLYNGQGRPVYRINIKFHGALFRRARDLVDLDPSDCFALATYKIYSALKRQEREGLPYFFAIVGVRTLSAENVGARIPSRFVDGTAFFSQSPRAQGKRDFEDRVVNRIVDTNTEPFPQAYGAIHSADWYILSARRADALVREKLYGRVFALRVPRFTKQFRTAEVDMHFSLESDLTRLLDFLGVLKEEGQAKVVTLLERGEY